MACEIVDTILEENGLDRDAVTAEALTTRLDEFDPIQRLIAASEVRCDGILHGLEDRCAASARRKRAAAIDVPADDES